MPSSTPETPEAAELRQVDEDGIFWDWLVSDYAKIFGGKTPPVTITRRVLAGDGRVNGLMSENAPTPADHIGAMRHLDPEGALSGLDLTDPEGIAIRAAIDLWGTTLDPPLYGNAAIRAALKDWLIGIGLWMHGEPNEGC